MNRWVKILSVICVLMIAVVVAGVVILKSIDFNEYKGLIAEAKTEKKASGDSAPASTEPAKKEESSNPVEGLTKGVGSGLKSLFGN